MQAQSHPKVKNVKPGVERRRAPRKRVDRLVVITRPDGAPALQQGLAIDLSGDGTQIQVPLALPIGSKVELEFSASAGTIPSPPLFLKGRVVHCRPLNHAGYALGIRLSFQPASATAMKPLARVAKVPLDRQPDPSTAALQNEPKSKRGNHRKLLIAFATAIALLLLCIPLQNALRKRNLPIQLTSEESTAPKPTLPKLQISEQFKKPTYTADKDKDRQIAQMRPENSDTATTLGDNTPRDRLSPPIPSLASMKPQKTNRKKGSAPPGFAGGSMLATLASPRAENASARDSESDDPLPPTSNQYADGESGSLSLVVDKSNFTLYIFRNGRILRTYLVSLGETTPTGDFTIGAKITDPDWYNQGKSVPAGDPKNPLGHRWIGLSQNGKPTSYGIHSTPESATLGKSQSRGCVRLNPDDTESLFRLCPIGTVVTIRP